MNAVKQLFPFSAVSHKLHSALARQLIPSKLSLRLIRSALELRAEKGLRGLVVSDPGFFFDLLH